MNWSRQTAKSGGGGGEIEGIWEVERGGCMGSSFCICG